MKPFRRWLSFMAPAWTLMACVRPMAHPPRTGGSRLDACPNPCPCPERPRMAIRGPIDPTGLGGSGRLNRVVPVRVSRMNGELVPLPEDCGAP